MRVLITAGGTREPIDRVRAITNTSTGATGTALAAELAALLLARAHDKTSASEGRSGPVYDRDASPKLAGGTASLAALGHSVELLRSASANAPLPQQTNVSLLPAFVTTADLEAALRKRLARGDIDAVIMAAAVADYRPATREAGKLDSAHDTLTLRLVRVPKLLPQLRKMSPRPLRVIGFKLTVGASETARTAAIAAQFASGAVDAVVHNDLLEIEAAAAHGKAHPFRFYTAALTLSTPNLANDAGATTPRKKNEAMPPLLLGTAALAAAINAFLHGQ